MLVRRTHIKKIFILFFLLSLVCAPSASFVFSATSPDLNGDGCVDTSDFLLLSSQFSISNPTTGDLNADGKVNIKDVGLLMSGWTTSGNCQSTVACPQLINVVNTNKDASSVIQKCLNQAFSGKTLALPPGVYMIGRQLRSSKSTNTFTLTTQGKTQNSPACSYGITNDCAELRATANFDADGKSDYGVVGLKGKNIILDHIVVNGNKAARANSTAAVRCANDDTIAGININVAVNGFQFLNSVSRNTLCATSLGIVGTNIVIKNSAFVANGTHNKNMMWSDGITSSDNNNGLHVINSTFIDNTDVHLIVGPGKNIKVQGNTFSHSPDPATGSFAALAIYDWGLATNNPSYAGSSFSGNTINCGSTRNCGFGILLGSDPWITVRPLHVQQATVVNNVVSDAQVGILVNEATQNMVKNNSASWSNPAQSATTRTTCGTKSAALYAMGNMSSGNDFGGQLFTSLDFDHCIPNWVL